MKFIPLLVLSFFLLNFACSDPANNTEATNANVVDPVSDTTIEIPAKPVKVENEKMTLKSEAELKQLAEENTKTELAKDKTTTSNKTKPAKELKKEEKKSTSATGRAKISFKEESFNFGHIDQGEVIKHSFVFENTGNSDLEIMNVDASCGCTIPTFPFIPIPPGEKGSIDVTYDSKGKLGNQSPSITVMTNAKPRKHVLYLKGVVDAERAVDEKKD